LIGQRPSRRVTEWKGRTNSDKVVGEDLGTGLYSSEKRVSWKRGREGREYRVIRRAIPFQSIKRGGKESFGRGGEIALGEGRRVRIEKEK